METIHPAATFTASRDELLGAHPLLGSAEIARDICRQADRTISILAVAPERMRRVDGWLGEVGFVTHAAAIEPSRALLGSVCDRDEANRLVRSIVASLVGELVMNPAAHPVEIPDLGAVSPATLPTGVEWLVIASAVPARVGAAAQRFVFAAVSGGLVGSTADAISGPCRLDPVPPDVLQHHLDDLVGAPPRSIHDLEHDA